MHQEAILIQIYQVIAKQLGHSVESLNLEHRLVADLGADSLDHVELVMAIEDEFNITLDDKEASEVVCVKDVVRLVNAKLNPQD